MPAHIFGTRETLQFDIAPKDPESFAMRQVDIHAAGTHVTATDNGFDTRLCNAVYLPWAGNRGVGWMRATFKDWHSEGN